MRLKRHSSVDGIRFLEAWQSELQCNERVFSSYHHHHHHEWTGCQSKLIYHDVREHAIVGFIRRPNRSLSPASFIRLVSSAWRAIEQHIEHSRLAYKPRPEWVFAAGPPAGKGPRCVGIILQLPACCTMPKRVRMPIDGHQVSRSGHSPLASGLPCATRAHERNSFAQFPTSLQILRNCVQIFRPPETQKRR
ncbi:unnamed protein product [Protopolystoma xenopodis]|uniref:Uncharacterized protein n=1 Tax=Protopolystoma xenopodis TaxID=117903 RepID=A0A3S5AL11_9PLAT|nr:unnamed protein product [Protopolystoma xenopodis]